MTRGRLNLESGEREPEAFLMSYVKTGGSKEMKVKGDVTPVDFRHVVPVGKIAVISRMLIHVVDGNPMTVDGFGGLGALANGIAISFRDSGDNLLLDPLDGGTIKTNYDWSELTGIDAEIKTGTSKSAMISRWSLFKTGAHMRLVEGDYIQFKVQDDLTGLGTFRVAIQGQLYQVG